MRGIIAMGVMVLLAISIAGAEEIYKWTDENGTVHYSNVPPPTQKTEDLDTVQEKTGVGKVGAPPVSQPQTAPVAPPQSTPEQQQEPTDFWVDENGGKHIITKQLIMQEKTYLEKQLRYYRNDCIRKYGGPFVEENRKNCKQQESIIEQKLKDLKTSPQQYFYNKYLHEKRRPQREIEWAEERAQQAEQRAREAEQDAREAEQRARDAEEGIPH